jgi:hypothetical protein
MWKRVVTRMRSATELLEATDRHLNQGIAILNCVVADRTLHFDVALAHGFATTLKRWRPRCEVISEE